MAKKKISKRTARKAGGDGKARRPAASAAGKHLVIVESPAKARTINHYLGSDYVVKASVGHVRDLPKRNPKGEKAPVPGVDIEGGFRPRYEVIQGKNKTVTDLRRTAREAADVYLATDLDREGEAIAWHLVEALGISPDRAKRVVFNAITKGEVERAFENPRSIDMDMVNAQQARRILDRIVGYQVSPLLWKKVAGGLSAGRVQSVAVRLIVDREREIRGFVPEEYWKITGYFAAEADRAGPLAEAWRKWLAEGRREKAEEKAAGGKAAHGDRTVRERHGWLSEHRCLAADLAEIDGRKVEPGNVDEAMEAARLAGFELVERIEEPDPKGKGPAEVRRSLIGRLADPRPDWRVLSIETKRTRSRPYAPFITSTLQQAAANQLNFTSQGAMRVAQQLYEGVEIGRRGATGLITYMRTDSTHLSREAIAMARDHIKSRFGEKYLPEKPNYYRTSDKAAQEAHEAIRPTDLSLTPEAVRGSLDDRQYKLYKLIWERFVACQMTPAEWDATAVRIGATSGGSEVVFRCTGRTLAFDGFYKVVGVPSTSDELILPDLREDQRLGAIQIDPQQKFTSPPPRYTEASLVKTLESEGIGRPSTYASIIQVIQDRKYVEKISNRFHATDLGMVVTDKLVEAFPRILDVGYTREMENQLDSIEEDHEDWVAFLERFYGPFRESLAKAHEELSHAKAETEPAPYRCPECGGETMYRFGKGGRFLSCANYPECKYAAPVDREGKPQLPELTDIACPECGKAMMRRTGRFGPFLSCSDYPECKGIVNLDKKGQIKPPKVPPVTTDIECPKCGAPLNLRSSKRGPWLSCSNFPKCRGRLGWSKLDEKAQRKWERALEEHERENPQPLIRTIHGEPVGDSHVPRMQGEPGDAELETIDE